MELLVIFLLGTVFVIFSFAVVFNWVAVKFKPKSNLGFLFAAFTIAVVGMLFFPNEPLEKNLPLMKLVLLPAVVYLIQLMWYIGPLQPLRQRRIERLRAKWQEELKMWENWVEALEWIGTHTELSTKSTRDLSVAQKEASRFKKKLAELV